MIRINNLEKVCAWPKIIFPGLDLDIIIKLIVNPLKCNTKKKRVFISVSPPTRHNQNTNY